MEYSVPSIGAVAARTGKAAVATGRREHVRNCLRESICLNFHLSVNNLSGEVIGFQGAQSFLGGSLCLVRADPNTVIAILTP